MLPTINKGRSLKAVAAAALLATVLSSAASAADKYVLEEVEETHVEFGTGWYIRGDIGVALGGVDKEVQQLGHAGANYVETYDVSQGFSFGAAVGYRFSPRIRGDISFDYISSEESDFANRIGAENCPGQYLASIPYTDPLTGATAYRTEWRPRTINNCTENTHQAHNAQLMRATGYYEFDPVGRFTPTLGLGVGVARVEYVRETTIDCRPNSAQQRCSNLDPLATELPQPGELYSTPIAINEGTGYHLAGTISAGFSYQLGQNTHIDTAYSYTHIADSALNGGGDGLGEAGLDNSLHQIKVGLRYDIW